eukprot:3765202-Rhodomonas_salina.3
MAREQGLPPPPGPSAAPHMHLCAWLPRVARDSGEAGDHRSDQQPGAGAVCGGALVARALSLPQQEHAAVARSRGAGGREA